MAVAIPGLSQAAEDALKRLTAEIKKKDGKLDIVAASLEPRIRQEFAAVSRALDERFGRNAILHGERDVINRVSPLLSVLVSGLNTYLVIETVKNQP